MFCESVGACKRRCRDKGRGEQDCERCQCFHTFNCDGSACGTYRCISMISVSVLGSSSWPFGPPKIYDVWLNGLFSLLLALSIFSDFISLILV